MSKSYILVVEDDKICCDIIDLYLSSAGHHVRCINTAQEALAFLRKNPTECDLIILDIMMPGMSGNDLLSIIKEDEKLKHIPVISQSGADGEAIRRSQALGAVCSIQKPYEMHTLKNIVHDILSDKIVSISASHAEGDAKNSSIDQHIA